MPPQKRKSPKPRGARHRRKDRVRAPAKPGLDLPVEPESKEEHDDSLRLSGVRTLADSPGAPPGLDDFVSETREPPAPGTISYTCVDFGPQHHEHLEATDDLETVLNRPRPAWATVRWINIDGLHPFVVNRFRAKFGFHTLAAEDVIHVPQRPRVETYENHLFLVVRMISAQEDEQLRDEQISMFLFQDLLITFQEDIGDCWDPIRKRLRTEGARIRERDASYLAYALLDALVDYNFPVLERYAEALDELEEIVMNEPGTDTLRKIQIVKKELGILRRVLWPTRDLIDTLIRSESRQLSEMTKTYLRDVYAHTVQLLDILDHHRETCASLTELYVSSVSNRMNEIMKVLTVLTSLFIPVTFLAGVYGMNFEYVPEFKMKYAYPTFWAICISIMTGLLYFFKKRGWIGSVRQLR